MDVKKRFETSWLHSRGPVAGHALQNLQAALPAGRDRFGLFTRALILIMSAVSSAQRHGGVLICS